MEPKLIRLPALCLAGFICNTTTRFGESFTVIPKFWHDYMDDGRMKRLQSEDFIRSGDHYGVVFPEDPMTGNFQYLIGLVVKEGAVVPAVYEVRELPPAAYAVFSSDPAEEENFTAAVYNTWAYIYGCWIPRSGVHIDGDACSFEFYGERAQAATGKVCEVYVPVICAPGMTAFPTAAGEPGAAEDFPVPEDSYASPNTTAVKV